MVTETDEAELVRARRPGRAPRRLRLRGGPVLTFRVDVDGENHLRCYSMSSSPGRRRRLQVTVKRVPGGLVSNWMLDHGRRGRRGRGHLPAGVFHLAPATRLVAFGAGSGITPVFSLIKTRAGHDRSRRVRLLVREPRPRSGDLRRRARRARRARTPTASRSCTTSTSSRVSSTPTPCAVRRGPGRRRLLRLRARRRSWTSSRTRSWPTASPPTASTSSGSPRPRRRPPPSRSRPPVPTTRRPPPGSRSSSTVDRHRRPPPRTTDPADRPAARHVAAVLVRVGKLRHVHGADRRGVRQDARQQRR